MDLSVDDNRRLIGSLEQRILVLAVLLTVRPPGSLMASMTQLSDAAWFGFGVQGGWLVKL